MLSRTWTRIALSYAVLVLITAGLMAFLLGEEFTNREEGALQARLGDQARVVAFSAASFLAGQASITSTNALAHDLGTTLSTRVTLIRPDGTVVGDSEEEPSRMENHSDRPEVIQALANPGSLGSASRLSATVGRNLLYVAVAVKDPSAPSHIVGVARVAYPTTSIERARDALWGDVALTVLLVSLPIALLGILLSRSIVGPLTALRETAYRFGMGEMSARSRMSSDGEIGELSREFNIMADQLSATIGQRTAERNQMAAVLTHMHDGIIITDAHGIVERVNPPAASLFNITTDKAIGRSLIELTHSHELHQALHAALTDLDSRQRLEIQVGKYSLTAVMTAVPSPSGGSPSGLVVLQDVTELRRLERVRRDFVANIGHELRTPLASIKLLAETLTTAIRDDPDAAQVFLSRIDIEVDDLALLVRELLELSRVESGQMELDFKPVPALDLLNRAVSRLQPQADRAGLTLSVQDVESLPLVIADAARVEQVLVNLLHNAIKFTPPGGQVTLGASPDGSWIRIHVADTGVGILPEDLPRIFERFYKADKARTGSPRGESGTGLGLAIAKHVVQAHGGQIWAKSESGGSQPGKGTTIYFTLPVAPS